MFNQLREDKDYELKTKSAIKSLLKSHLLSRSKRAITPDMLSKQSFMTNFCVLRFNNGRQTGKTKNTLEIITKMYKRPLFVTIKLDLIESCIKLMKKHNIKQDNITFKTHLQLEDYFKGQIPGNLGPKDHDIIVLDVYGFKGDKNKDILKMLCNNEGVNPYATILCLG